MIPTFLLFWSVVAANAGYPLTAWALALALVWLLAAREWRNITAGRCACCLSEGHAVLYRVPLPGRRVDARCADCAAAGRVAA